MTDDIAIVIFADSLHLGFRNYFDKNPKGDYRLLHPATRHFYYCDNYFTCSENEFLKHLQKCMSIEEIIYKFENNKIISFQDNFKYLGDVAFTVYFDFETTRDVFHDLKMFVINYRQIHAFHLSLNLDKIFIFRSFRQKADEIYSLDHFRNDTSHFLIELLFSS